MDETTRQPLPQPPAAVLFDQDGTLVVNVPYNADPARVRPVPGALTLLRRLRAEGIPTGVITNQSGVGRGLITEEDLDRVLARVDELLGPFDVVVACPHLPEDGCECRKPAPGMVLQACEVLGVDPSQVVVVGDIAADLGAAQAAGAHGVMVPNADTLVEEVAAAPYVARTLPEVGDLLLPTRAVGLSFGLRR